MSLDIIKNMTSGNVDLKLAFQCAPVISGIKISNLLKINKKVFGYVLKILKDTGLSLKIIGKEKKNLLILVYREKELSDYLSKKEVSGFMYSLGYKNLDIDEVFKNLIIRYKAYKGFKKDFPHELGLLLGYPIGDVSAFIRNKGKGFLYCGYWKVYSDVERKIALFKTYEEVQARFVSLVYAGLDITDIIKMINMDPTRISLQMVCA